ncbi:unnamed protein product [Microthlaspi erraticum]|uniref:Phorbol-ester/DAG-type domain-containing protein n=1 Tax=Microthlaspi erraticum TaxID=1685480 RepID=A0A6D2KQ62_9BRAS|nr:unnamed protein product [Microthlaspi erraticum]
MDEEALESFLGAVRLNFHHQHLVYPTNIFSKCGACSNYEHIEGSERGENGEGVQGSNCGYICKPCNLYVHKDCIQINNPHRHKHSLKLLEFMHQLDDGRKCLVCRQEVEGLFYYCALCDVTVCRHCLRNPLVIDDVPKKVHEHSLTLVMIKVSFTCDACGVCSDGFPCVCLSCCFIIHKDCIKLPRVIHINRHDHRVSHAYSPGPGDWVCGVCRKGIDRMYGAYSCSVCRYAVHSQCAIRMDVWDGLELEDVPEDENEDLDPFEVIGEGLIKHFSHEHDLRLVISGSDENKEHCYVCTFPIYNDPYYTCMECHFIIHETCANLLKKKRHEIESHQLTLCVNPKPGIISSDSHFLCRTCGRKCTGFCYRYKYTKIDVHCARVSNTLNHGSHPHPLFCFSTENKLCSACRQSSHPVMSCMECDFDLCFCCATLPKEVRHKYDRHPLSLCYGESASGLYWCEICEGELNPKEWFYTCNDCGSTLHVNCVLGDYLHIRPGHSFKAIDEEEFEVVANDGPTRPFCKDVICKKRCVQPFVMKSKDKNNRYKCDYSCISDHYRFGDL